MVHERKVPPHLLIDPTQNQSNRTQLTLQHLRPHPHILKRAPRQAPNDRIRHIPNPGLQRKQVLGQTPCGYFGREEVDEVGGDEARFVVLGVDE